MIKLPVQNTECRICAIGTVATLGPKNRCIMPVEFSEAEVMLVSSDPTVSEDIKNFPFAEKYSNTLVRRVEGWGKTVYSTLAVKCIWKQKATLPAKAINVCATAYLADEIANVKPKHIIIFGATAWKAVTGSPTGYKSAESQRVWSEKLQAYLYVTSTLKTAAYKIETRQKIDADFDNFEKWILDAKTHQSFDPCVVVVDTQAMFEQMRVDLARYPIVACDIETTGLDYFDPAHNIRMIQFCGDPDSISYVLPLDIGASSYFGHLELFRKRARMEQAFVPGEKRVLRWSVSQLIRTYEDFIRFCPSDYCVPEYYWDDTFYKGIISWLRDFFQKTKIIWHNGKFDRLWLHSWGERLTGRPIKAPLIAMDTMHMAFLLDENRLLGLKRLITTDLGIPTYDIGSKVTPDLDLLYPYAGADTAATYLLAVHYREQMALDENAPLWKLYTHLMRRADVAYTDIELRGWPVDAKIAEEIREILLLEAQEKEKIMEAYLEEHGITDPVTYSAPRDIGQLLFTRLKLPQNQDRSIALTPTGGFSVDEDALYHLVEAENPFVVALLKWRGIQKALSTYVEPMLEAFRTRGRLTTTYKLTGTVTGRTASGKEGSGSSGMNLQNLPHDWGIRRIVRTVKGKVLIEADLSQIELRVAAELSGDPLLIEVYRQNKDVHTMRGMRLKKVDEEGWEALDKWVRDDARTKAKPVNFGFLYGMSWRKFMQYALIQYGVHFSASEATKVREQFFADHSGLLPWYAKQARQAERLGYVTSLSGRRRRLPNAQLKEGISGMTDTILADAIRQAINTPVQGFASDLKVMAVIELCERLDPEVACVIGEIHDSILIECLEEHAAEVGKLAVQVMRHPRILDEMGIELTVPIDAEAKYGPSLYKKEMQVIHGA